MLSELTPSQRALAEYMSDLSEDAYCAGWMLGGWIVFDDTTQETWLPMGEWERRFAEWEKRARPDDG